MIDAGDDDDIWRAYKKAIKPLPATKRLKPDAKKPIKKPVRTGLAVPTGLGIVTKRRVEKRAINCDDWYTEIDKKAERDMRSGDVEIDARIDLHGMTQVEAHHALARFMATSVRRGDRMLLVITGKGKMGNGVLRHHLPMWLEALPEASMIAKLRHASVKHGGEGAVYVMLRKAK